MSLVINAFFGELCISSRAPLHFRLSVCIEVPSVSSVSIIRILVLSTCPGIIIGFYFFQLKTNQGSIRSRQSLVNLSGAALPSTQYSG
jgi:hypothetical protein